jgi:hypothetical protein
VQSAQKLIGVHKKTGYTVFLLIEKIVVMSRLPPISFCALSILPQFKNYQKVTILNVPRADLPKKLTHSVK